MTKFQMRLLAATSVMVQAFETTKWEWPAWVVRGRPFDRKHDA